VEKMNIIAEIIKKVIGLISPELRGILVSAIDQLDKKAKETSNPYDDIIVMILKALLSI